MRQQFAAAIGKLVALEQEVSATAAEAHAEDECRVYEWRPSGLPELPAIWNMIDDGTYEVIDTARADDLVILRVSIGVKPSDLSETMGRLMRLTDVFRAVVDPALARNHPLDNTVRYAKRVVTRTGFDDFGGVPVMCMEMLIRLELSASIR